MVLDHSLSGIFSFFFKYCPVVVTFKRSIIFSLMLEVVYGSTVLSSDPEAPAKRRKEESKEEILEMMENTENPLRCPVRLYEFYLSKW